MTQPADQKCPKCGAPFMREWKAGRTTRFACGTEWDDVANCPYGALGDKCYERQLQALAADNERMRAEVSAANEERTYFMGEIYEWGCQAAMVSRDVDAQRRMHGFIWQRICILKDAIKHGSRDKIRVTPTGEQP